MTSSNGKFAVVTGASSGIGFELARQFAQNGFDLLIAAEDEKIYECAQTLQQFGVTVTPVQVDLAMKSDSMESDSGVMKLWNEIESSGRTLDAIAINAGVGVGGRFDETEFDREINMIDLNIVSTYHLAKHVAKKMKAQGSGRILFTASIAAVMPTPYETVYGATKAFVLSLSNGLRAELKDYGVSITALMPGPTETNFFHRAGLDDTKIGADEKDIPADVARDGYKALMDGDDKVISHAFKSKLQGYMSYFASDEQTAAMHKKMAEPGSAQKSAA